MTLWLVAWLSVTQECPFWAKALPSWVKAAVCTERRAYEWTVTSYRAEADKQVRAVGGDALLLELRGGRARRKQIRQVLEIEP